MSIWIFLQRRGVHRESYSVVVSTVVTATSWCPPWQPSVVVSTVAAAASWCPAWELLRRGVHRWSCSVVVSTVGGAASWCPPWELQRRGVHRGYRRGSCIVVVPAVASESWNWPPSSNIDGLPMENLVGKFEWCRVWIWMRSGDPSIAKVMRQFAWMWPRNAAIVSSQNWLVIERCWNRSATATRETESGRIWNYESKNPHGSTNILCNLTHSTMTCHPYSYLKFKKLKCGLWTFLEINKIVICICKLKYLLDYCLEKSSLKFTLCEQLNLN